MRQIKLSKHALRIFTMQLEQKGEGFNIGDLRKLDKVLTVLEVPLSEYNSKIEHEIKETRRAIKEAPTMVDSLNQALNDKLDQLQESEGKDQVTVTLEDDPYAFVLDLWTNTKGFLGKKEVRKVVIELDDALNNAKMVEDSPKEEPEVDPKAN